MSAFGYTHTRDGLSGSESTKHEEAAHQGGQGAHTTIRSSAVNLLTKNSADLPNQQRQIFRKEEQEQEATVLVSLTPFSSTSH
jgi:hypothetical protein